ncbi:hypothetical protein SADUNF_Sadunf11G0073900 [Salix dunnii]|uniref:Tyrosinase copper-binding domain-containing protein n=1 Tax=Salix dunnii TaxID=1413687 RepID=A0A835JP46_9ROSI|nr:hypothetical protein SADUNF_Sadunf11G0073900 [Salix dunnii]
MSTLSFCLFFPKPQQVTKIKRPNQLYISRVSCKATDDTQKPATRRDVLIGLGGLYSATNLTDRTANAKPISPPDLTNCELVDFPNLENPTNCCPPLSKKIIDFRPPSPFSPLRTRRAAHLVDEDYVAKYAEAISLMKSLLEDDPQGDPNPTNTNQLYSSNLRVVYRQMVSGAAKPTLFSGNPYRAGDDSLPGSGTIESYAHNNIHKWTGDPTQENTEDMGIFYSASRDPIFFCHHSNVDRLCTIWKTIPGGIRRDISGRDWLNSEFLFYNENAELVRCKGLSWEEKKLKLEVNRGGKFETARRVHRVEEKT